VRVYQFRHLGWCFKGCNVTTFYPIKAKRFPNNFSDHLQQLFLGRNNARRIFPIPLKKFIRQSS